MKRLTLAAAAAAAVVGLSGAAMAQGYTGWYLGARGGATWLDDVSSSISGTATNVDFDTGYNIGAHVGYDFGAFRLEGEVVYRNNDIDTMSAGGARLSGVSGSANSLAVMLNAYYDIELGWPVVPYVGAGIGWAQINSKARATGLGFTIDDDDSKLAYQLIAGASWWLNPSLALTLDYRYFATDDPSFSTSTGSSFSSEYKTHNVALGLTFRFPAPARVAPAPAAAPPPPPPPAAAPPPPPAPPPAAPKTYLVFFDFDKSDITPEAGRIIAQAAADAKSMNVRLIVATGHADRAGPDAYNQRLSERRANAVKARLTREGVPANIIQTQGRGERENLVQTADGVREPRNRRVEIVFR
jgi:outer membrane protein OmpA-like peptidoglycan-associated protein